MEQITKKRNIPWLIEKGFLIEKKTKTALKPGMILKMIGGGGELVVTPEYKLLILSGYPSMNGTYWHHNRKEVYKTLEEFHKESMYEWEIVKK